MQYKYSVPPLHLVGTLKTCLLSGVMLYVVTLSDTFPLKLIAFTYLHTVVFENVFREGTRYNLIHCSS